MIEVLHHHIISRLGHDIDHLESVLSAFEPMSVKRNVQLLQQGEICNHVYFVVKGCLQVYIYDKDFNENTRDIVIENHWCSELLSFGGDKPATENIRTVEPCELLAIDRKKFQHLIATVPQFNLVYKQILEASYANSVYRLNTFVSLTAIERMQWLMEYRPSLMSRLSSKLIASYLGINKDVYSRLKAKL
jgi:CRP-like cAMP-binding protein